MQIKRIIVTLTFVDGILFGTRNFKPDYRYTYNFVDTWDVDEIILLDITNKNESKRNKFYNVLKILSEKCFVPITAGGNIDSISEIKKLLSNGADKVAINSKLNDENFIKEAVQIFGSSCIVGSLDFKENGDDYEIYCDKGSKKISSNFSSYLKRIQKFGIGEILIQSIDKDGSLEGYDIKLIKRVLKLSSVPVIACSGAGNWKHFYECFSKTNVSGASTTNIFHFTNKSIRNVKKFLLQKKISIRQIKDNTLDTN